MFLPEVWTLFHVAFRSVGVTHCRSLSAGKAQGSVSHQWLCPLTGNEGVATAMTYPSSCRCSPQIMFLFWCFVCVFVWKMLDVYCFCLPMAFFFFDFNCKRHLERGWFQMIFVHTCTYACTTLLNSAGLSGPLLLVSMAKRNFCRFTCFHWIRRSHLIFCF